MKITKTQFKQIINEELSAVLNEFGQGMAGKHKAHKDIASVFGGKIIPAGEEFTAQLVSAGKVAKNVPMENIGELYQQRDGVYYVTVGPARATGERYYIFGDDLENLATGGQADSSNLNELGIGRALKGMGGALKGKAFDKVKGMKGPVAQHTQAQKQIQGIVTDMVKKDPDSAVQYAQFLTKLVQSIAPAKTGEAGFEE